ncbi:MAG: MOSC domain-containing protein [Gemmatimonadota bacterium]|nr:MOSC domain-containing protein [Gemmatimonadota bacterium]
MTIEIGHIEAIFRYPVKSMAGGQLEAANLGWHGLDGDRRLAFRRTQDRSGFPWLSASKLPDLLRFTPVWREQGLPADLPTHVRTPDGKEMAVFGEELAAEVELRLGAPVQMMELRQGIFDEASLSVISVETLREIGKVSGTTPDVRRFRPNVLVRLLRPDPFQEDGWVGGVLSFGEVGRGPSVSVIMRDTRCSMVNLDPDSARSSPEMLKAVVQMNQNKAGIYGAVIRTGQLAVGQTVHLQAFAENGPP